MFQHGHVWERVLRLNLYSLEYAFLDQQDDVSSWEVGEETVVSSFSSTFTFHFHNSTAPVRTQPIPKPKPFFRLLSIADKALCFVFDV